jgi:hypothetical protein
LWWLAVVSLRSVRSSDALLTELEMKMAAVRSITGTVLSQNTVNSSQSTNRYSGYCFTDSVGTILRQQFYNLVMPPMRPQLGRRVARFVARIDVCAVLQ